MICHFCEKKYVSVNKKSKYCSRSCYQAGRSEPMVKKNCLQCGNGYFIHPCFERVGKKQHCSFECRSKTVSEKLRGEKSPMWKGGITPRLQKVRQEMGIELRQWRGLVFKRDNWTCQNCNQRGGWLEADHIKPFSLFPDLRLDLSNGRTLCRKCHYSIGWNLFRENNPRIVNN